MQFPIYFEGYLFIADRPFGLNLYLGGNLPSHFFIVNIFYLFWNKENHAQNLLQASAAHALQSCFSKGA